MNLAHLILSFATLSAAPQEAAELKLVDRVEVIVNDEILTLRQVMGTVASRVPEGVTLSALQLAELRNSVGRELIDERLKVQGGIDMGFEEQAVDRIVANNTRRRIGSAGGVVQMADELDGKGVSLFEQESELRRNLYRFSWERAITGANVGVAGRAFRDRYVRPGQLRLRYDFYEAGQMRAEAITGTSARYHLQELIVRIGEESDGEPARMRAELIRESLEDGLDFTTAIHNAPEPPENDGFLPPLTGEDLARNGGVELATFAISATPGEVSRPIPILRGKRLAGWRLMKLIDSDAPLLPVFELARTQNLLRRVMQSEGDDYRREMGLEGLNRGAYIWIMGAPKN